jgi:phosphotransferase system enzyme I (PtsI)
MYPMITSPEELRRIRQLEEQAREQLEREGLPYAKKVPTGIMIETPAAALLSEELAKQVDFFSVGTNDLTQYTLALDRQNPTLKQFDDPEHRAVLMLVEMAAKSAHQAGIRIGICGELAADTSLTETFLRMGIDELSVAPPMILEVRKRIREL